MREHRDGACLLKNVPYLGSFCKTFFCDGLGNNEALLLSHDPLLSRSCVDVYMQGRAQFFYYGAPLSDTLGPPSTRATTCITCVADTT